MTVVSTRYPFCFHPQDAETAVVVVEGDALDDAGEFLGGGFAFWDCGSLHRECIFPRTVCLGRCH
jgi:hypothetical protein